MAKSLDVYRDWLGIEETARPLDYYQLLRLKQFDDDVERIRRHYRKMTAHSRKYASGDFAVESQRLLNELARAMLCLTDAARKAEYDAAQGRRQAGPGERQSMEQILLRSGIVDQAQLDEARDYAAATGFPLRDALLQRKLAKPEDVVQAYAESLGLPYLDLGDVSIDTELVSKISAVAARQHSLVPVMVDNEQLLVASPNPLVLDVEEDLKMRIGMPLRMVLCTPTDVNRLIGEYYPREAAEKELRDRSAAPDKDENVKPTGLAKVWAGIVQWVKDNS